MLIGGADVSGDSREGQQKHIAFLVGKEESINKLHDKIGLERIHMSTISEKDRMNVYRNLKSISNDIHVWCFHVDRQRIEEHIQNHKKFLKYKMPKHNIHKNFDLNWLRLFRSELENTTMPFGIAVTDLVIQTDGDMVKTIRNWRMKNSNVGKAHELADAVAWCNQKNIKIDCKVLDLRDEIKKKMEQTLLK